MNIVTLAYAIIILIFLAIGAAIIFHLLYYKINRRVSWIMFVVYAAGSILLLISNFTLFGSVDWYQIFSGFRL